MLYTGSATTFKNNVTVRPFQQVSFCGVCYIVPVATFGDLTKRVLKMGKGSKVLRPSVFIGEVFTNKSGDEFELVEYVKAIKIRLKSLLTGNDQIWTNVANIRKGNI